MIELSRYLKPFRWIVAVSIFLTFIQCLTQLYLPKLMADMVDVGIVGNDMNYIITIGLVMLFLSAVSMVSSVAAGYYASKASAGFSRDLRRDIYTKVDSLSLEEFEKFGTSTLVTRTTNDVNQIQNVLIMLLRIFVMSPLMFLGGVVMTVLVDPVLSLIIVVAIPVLFGFIYIIIRKCMPLFKQTQKKLDHLSLTLRERLTGVRVIRAFNKEESANQNYRDANADLTDVSLRVNKILSFIMPAMTIIMNVTVIGVLWFGSFRVASGNISVGDIMAFIQYVMMILFSVAMTAMIFVFLPRAKVSAERIIEILDVDPKIKDSNLAGAETKSDAETEPDAETEGIKSGKKSAQKDAVARIEFKNVSFHFEDSDKNILDNVSFAVYPGETAAVIGGTGAGKSSLINLVPRFYDVTGGSVFVEGRDVRETPQSDLRQKIGFVPQTAVLFSGTVAENIRYGKSDATDEEIWNALKVAQADDFVGKMNDGLDSFISQGGTNVSGGQKQRLTIARAVVRHPDIYIFDDNFSALDYKTDANLRRALKKEIKDAAVLIVAQRVSTIKDADKIIVLDNGAVVGIGTDDELMKSCQVYQEIVASQQMSAEVDV
ncbi:putative ABC transporter ATP-binding protein [Methanosarcinaceae archaeon Ag5]|uniref:ABC transporter ATP-binding protein n=1 Tax=Methanolapillus africanus TaxID=3028297 RepID=A0AAE4SFC6_9EURY|nr:putative ABC transporter ATP-binding protein [Methanosarcinaceae archaeon Ag5]